LWAEKLALLMFEHIEPLLQAAQVLEEFRGRNGTFRTWPFELFLLLFLLLFFLLFGLFLFFLRGERRTYIPAWHDTRQPRDCDRSLRGIGNINGFRNQQNILGDRGRGLSGRRFLLRRRAGTT
jgi:hypothetical protein